MEGRPGVSSNDTCNKKSLTSFFVCRGMSAHLGYTGARSDDLWNKCR